ncbi:acyltransferase [Candidatus Beckwithbacteria bacterium]|nr:acyltransferase [Candidatus Beckwithbacteria bacterium]
MFGLLRLIFASLVIVSHLDIFPKVPEFTWFNQGIWGLVGFFILSGFLMKLTWEKKYLNQAIAFYKDRIIRIFPQYYFWLTISILLLVLIKFNPWNLHILSILAHIFVIPLNLVRILDLKSFTTLPFWGLVIPPAWSLGSELQFYLLIPWLFKKTKNQLLALIISLIIWTIASFNLIPTETWAFRLLP